MISIICIGNEVVNGTVVNSNHQKIATILNQHGYNLHNTLLLNDDITSISVSIKHLLTSSIIIITIGGLGPTEDDKTREAIAAATNRELVESETQGGRCSGTKKVLLKPNGSSLIQNVNGSAPGLKMKIDNCTIYSLPGPPEECLTMFNNTVLKDIKAQLKSDFNSTTISIMKPESEIERFIKGYIKSNQTPYNLDYSLCIQDGYCDLTFRSTHDTLNNIEPIVQQHFKNFIVKTSIIDLI